MTFFRNANLPSFIIQETSGGGGCIVVAGGRNTYLHQTWNSVKCTRDGTNFEDISETPSPMDGHSLAG